MVSVRSFEENENLSLDPGPHGLDYVLIVEEGSGYGVKTMYRALALCT